MKKRIFNVCATTIMAVLIITVAIHFTSCQKECSTCVPPEPDVIKQVTFNLIGKSMKSEVNIIKFNIEGVYRENVQPPKSDEKLFQFFKEYCTNKNIEVDNQAMAFVLYYDSLITSSPEITDDYIKGISLYNVEGKKIIHHLFVRNEKSDFYEVENVKVAVPGITFSHIDFYFQNYVLFNSQSKQAKSEIILMGDFAVEVWKNIKKYRTPMRYEIEVTTRGSKAMAPGPGGRCGSDSRCPHGPENSCLAGPDNASCGDLCVSKEMRHELQMKNRIEHLFIDLDLMYAFRDDFLYHSEKGEVYIDNYYYLSEEYDGKIGLVLAVKSALFFKDFNPVMKAFVNPEQHLKEILFTDELSTSLLNLLDEYEKITGSSEGKAMLASVRKDVHAYKNKQLQEILAMIK